MFCQSENSVSTRVSPQHWRHRETCQTCPCACWGGNGEMTSSRRGIACLCESVRVHGLNVSDVCAGVQCTRAFLFATRHCHNNGHCHRNGRCVCAIAMILWQTNRHEKWNVFFRHMFNHWHIHHVNFMRVRIIEYHQSHSNCATTFPEETHHFNW